MKLNKEFSVIKKDWIFKQIAKTKTFKITNLNIWPYIKFEWSIIKYYFHNINENKIFKNYNRSINSKILKGNDIISIFVKNFEQFDLKYKNNFSIIVYFYKINNTNEFTINGFINFYNNNLNNNKFINNDIDIIQLNFKNFFSNILTINFDDSKINNLDLNFLKSIQKDSIKNNELQFYKKEIVLKSENLWFLNCYYLMKILIYNCIKMDISNISMTMYFEKSKKKIYLINFKKLGLKKLDSTWNTNKNLLKFKWNNFFKKKIIDNNNMTNTLIILDSYYNDLRKKNRENINLIINPSQYNHLTKEEKILLVNRKIGKKNINFLCKYLQIKNIKIFPIVENFLKKKINSKERKNNWIKNFFKVKINRKTNKNSINTIKYNSTANNFIKDQKSMISNKKINLINDFVDITYNNFNNNDILKDLNKKKFFKRKIYSRGQIFYKNSKKNYSIPYLIKNKNII